jgi:hypothetical protein
MEGKEPGWYPDPEGDGERYWDGRQWHSKLVPGEAREEAWKQNPWSKLPTWGKWGLGIAAIFVVVGIAVGDESEDAQPEPSAAESRPAPAKEAAERSEPPPPKSTSEPVERAPSSQQLVREALGNSVSADLAIGESEVRSVYRTGQLMNVVLSAPEGGFEGPSTDDADALASEALAKVYGDVGWDGAAWVEFRGGLASSATGRALPNAEAFAYRVERNEAPRIDWSDEEALYVIDWSLYRAFCHPAFKGC